MATAKQPANKRGIPWLKLLLALALTIGGITWFYGEAIAGFAQAGTGYAAKNACSCRHIGGRELASCDDDMLPGMEAIWLSEDEDEQSVTATVPLVESSTATWREGYGCMLEPWDG